jgi:hypothetical protein
MVLLMNDTWFADIFQARPLTRTDLCQILLPCDGTAFREESSTAWRSLVQTGQGLVSGAVLTIASDGITISSLTSSHKVSRFATHAIISAIRLRMHETRYHHDPLATGGSDQAGAQDAWAMCMRDFRSSRLVRFVLDFGTVQKISSANANCLVSWHLTCVSLAADLHLFERAAGQDGPEPARTALAQIGTWSSTPTARRACIHAAQAFKTMAERRASDGVMFHSIVALFQCALVLSLYILMRQPFANDDSCAASPASFELLSPFDLCDMGTEGFEDQVHPDDIIQPRAMTDAVRFVRGEVDFTFNEAEQTPSYQSARLVLLDYASLLEDIGTRWRIAGYAHILRIMSDTIRKT